VDVVAQKKSAEPESPAPVSAGLASGVARPTADLLPNQTTFRLFFKKRRNFPMLLPLGNAFSVSASERHFPSNFSAVLSNLGHWARLDGGL